MDINKFVPLYDKVVVLETKLENKTASGLILAGEDNRFRTGIVTQVGHGRITAQGNIVPLTIKHADIVYFPKYSGLEIEPGYILLREDEIIGTGNK